MSKLTRWIAFRYLKSKKSHGAVSTIAAVSVAGVALATAAVVCVLSVFNGFRDVLVEKFDTLAPDIVISPAKGKIIANPDSLASALLEIDGVQSVVPVVSDKALAVFNGQELPVTIKGVNPDSLAARSGIKSTLLPGSRLPVSTYQEEPEEPDWDNITIEEYEAYEEALENRARPEALLAIGSAKRLGNLMLGDEFLLFAPTRTGRYNPAAPYKSFRTDSVMVAGIFHTKQKEYDEDMVIVPIELARHLFQYDTEATSLEITVRPGTPLRQVKDRIQLSAGEDLKAQDRAELHEINFRMINIEKWVSFLLLAFILMIAGFNIISTMTMLVLEKKRQMSVMNALGMRKSRIGAVFKNESIMVSVLGGIIGIGLGVFLCWLQQEYGFIRLNSEDPSKLLMTEYPVKIVWGDVALAFVPSVVLGLIAAAIAGAFARSRISSNPAGSAA